MALPLESTPGDGVPIAAINTTPLVDVMLVLLIVFLITVPVVTTSVSLALPQEPVAPRETQPEDVLISVDRFGHAFWYDTPVPNGEALVQRLKAVSVRRPQPQVQIRGDRNGPYAGVGRVLYACQRAGIAKVAFITEPLS